MCGSISEQRSSHRKWRMSDGRKTTCQKTPPPFFLLFVENITDWEERTIKQRRLLTSWPQYPASIPVRTFSWSTSLFLDFSHRSSAWLSCPGVQVWLNWIKSQPGHTCSLEKRCWIIKVIRSCDFTVDGKWFKHIWARSGFKAASAGLFCKISLSTGCEPDLAMKALFLRMIGHNWPSFVLVYLT